MHSVEWIRCWCWPHVDVGQDACLNHFKSITSLNMSGARAKACHGVLWAKLRRGPGTSGLGNDRNHARLWTRAWNTLVEHNDLWIWALKSIVKHSDLWIWALKSVVKHNGLWFRPLKSIVKHNDLWNRSLKLL